MHWVQRGKHRYLYYTVVKDGKTVREYHGTGPEAELRFAQDQQRRAAQRELKKKIQQQLVAAELVRATVADYCSWSDLMAKASLITAGYHHHQRCEWRRRCPE